MSPVAVKAGVTHSCHAPVLAPLVGVVCAAVAAQGAGCLVHTSPSAPFYNQCVIKALEIKNLTSYFEHLSHTLLNSRYLSAKHTCRP